MGNLIIKDNALIEASHRLSEVEQRLVLLAILKARDVGGTVEQLRGKELLFMLMITLKPLVLANKWHISP